MWAANTDSINLSSSVDPYCEVEFNAQPIASNLDLTTSQSDLYVGDIIIRTNTAGSAWNVPHTIDISGILTHSNNINTFSLGSTWDLVDFGGAGALWGSVPFGNQVFPGDSSAEASVKISYTGIPALSLVQGTYSTTWYTSCAIEPKE